MKKKKVFSKILAIVLVLSLMLTTFPSFSAFAQETSSKEQLTEKGDLWQPESNSNMLNFEGDLSIEELQSAKLSDEDTPEIVSQESIEENGHVNRLWKQEEDLNSKWSLEICDTDSTHTIDGKNYRIVTLSNWQAECIQFGVCWSKEYGICDYIDDVNIDIDITEKNFDKRASSFSEILLFVKNNGFKY